ncbi:MAG TPA: MobF family relaxase, partial [Pirellulales bacterium]
LKDKRVVGMDFNFHVPKSASILAMRDERIVEAFRESVDETMRDIETEVLTRVRKGGKNEERCTGNMVWGEFIHFTSRPMDDGIPDPHLHAHCFALNSTYDEKEKSWKASQFREIKGNAPYFEAVFHSRFTRKLAELGLPVERTRKGWEIEGLSRGLIDKFSRRTASIEETARKLGIEDPEKKAELGARTRKRKAKNLTLPQLEAEWRGRMSPQEVAAVDRLAKKIGSQPIRTDERVAPLAMTYAIGHEFERRSVVPERQLLTTALKRAVGKATLEQVQAQVDRAGVIIGERNGRRMATTREVLNEERYILNFARGGRGVCRPLGTPDCQFNRERLNASQQAAVQHVLDSHDRVILLRGAAGVGKTTLMREAFAAIEASGTKVVALAPTAEASRGVLNSEGFKGADTVARMLVDQRFQQQAKGELLFVDEAGLLGAKTTAELFALADRLDCRVLLTGDRKQHGSVEHGTVLQMLEEEAGLKPAEVKEIKRQSGEYKAAIKALSEHRIGEGFSRLDKLGWIREIPDDERYKQLAADYVDAVSAGKTALAVSPTHAEGDRITDEIRRLLKERRILGAERHTFRVLQNANLTEAERGDELNYLPGDVLQFHQNGKSHTRGDRVSVNGKPLPLDQAKRFAVFHARTLELVAGDVIRITHSGSTADEKHRLNNGALFCIKTFDAHGNIVLDNGWTVAKDFGHLTHGFVVTSHSSQGKSVDRVFVGQSSQSFPATSREQFYVSCSRGRESVTVYCDDKEALSEAVEQSDERISATELIKGSRQRSIVALHERYHEPSPERKQVEREGLSYDR